MAVANTRHPDVTAAPTDERAIGKAAIFAANRDVAFTLLSLGSN